MATTSQHNMFGDSEVVHREPRRKAEKPRVLVGRVLMLGAGVQSSTLAEMIVLGDVPPVDLAIFADTGDEPPWVYEQVWYLAERLAGIGVPLQITYFSKTSLSETAKTVKGRFASMPLFTRDPASGRVSMLRRQCTNEWKIQPANSVVLDWLVKQGWATPQVDKLGRWSRRVNPGVCVEYLLGISLDEFTRMKQSGPGWQHNVYPLIDQRITRADCAQYLLGRGLPLPKKSSCIMCPFHDDDYWSFLKQEHPSLFEQACQFDDWLRTPEGSAAQAPINDDTFLHRSGMPLRDVDFNSKLPMEELCDGFCMT